MSIRTENKRKEDFVLNKFKTALKTLTSVFITALVALPVIVTADTIQVNSLDEVSVGKVEQVKRNVLHTQLDSQGRPYQSTFIGNDYYQVGKRVGNPSEPQNLIGSWYQQKVKQNGKSVYLWDRGHLIGNQFAGKVSNISSNITGQTSYTNQKLMTYFEGGTKKSNPNALDNWLYLHPNYYIEYQVTANYSKPTDNYPTSITLRYRGLDKSGNPIRIRIPDSNLEGIGKQREEQFEFTSVDIQNIMPGYTINYETGTATVGGNSPVASSDRKVFKTTIKRDFEVRMIIDWFFGLFK